MSIYDRLAKSQPVQVSPASTSYFSEPTEDLDPFLFQGVSFRSNVRQQILSLVHAYLGDLFSDSQAWAKVWLAGSGVSHQWSAARNPGDLDCLIGVDWLSFRRANRDLAGLSDRELASYINSHFRERLGVFQHDWNGYDLTMYVNPGGTDIRDIHPYAAFNLSDDRWDVEPDPHPEPPSDPAWAKDVAADAKRAAALTGRYNAALEQVQGSVNPAYRVSASTTLRAASQEAIDLFDEIHEGRHAAFSSTGKGYGDWTNYRWQAGKASGAIEALKRIKDDISAATGQEQASLYGGAIASPQDSLIASAIGRRYRG